MEKILDDREKIKRAEEIYYRRNNINSNNINNSNKVRSKTKFGFHFLMMLNIAIIIFFFQNRDFVFTKEFLMLLENYNNTISEKTILLMKEIVNKEDDRIENNTVENYSEGNTSIDDNNIQEKEVEENLNIVPQNISSSISEMQLDVQNLKNAYSFIKPVVGVVSSNFGARESKYQNVTGYHTGIDIAADKGTNIVASMQGIVDLVSNEGDYGKHIKIRSNNVTTLYAHCSKIFVKEGQIVAEGQKIAEVGSTGNSTGPHLHFEIRVEDRFIDPSQIINFK